MSSPPEYLSTDDARILGVESEAIKGHTCKVVIVEPVADEPLDVDSLRAHLGERLARVPKFSERVQRAPDGRSAWAPAGDPDLDWHVREATGEPLSEEDFRLLAGSLMAERLDHTRPLWRIDTARLEDGSTALVFRIHHAMADGVSCIRALSALLWDPVEEIPRSPSAPVHPDPPGRHGAFGAAGVARLPGTLLRELRPGTDTNLDHHIGPEREVAWRIVSLPRVKEIASRAGEGFTVNDVVLAIVAGALERWPGRRATTQEMRVQIPVSLHSADEASGALSNRDSFFNVDLPVGEPDCRARLRRINAETRVCKSDHDAETLYAFFHAMSRFGPLYKGVTRIVKGPREFALSVSNVPGPRGERSVLGHPVSEFCSFAEPADRHALRVAVVSFGDSLAFALCSDPEAIPGLDGLAAGLGVAVEELAAA